MMPYNIMGSNALKQNCACGSMVVKGILFTTIESSSTKGGLDHISRKLYIFFVTSHNFFPLSSVQIIIIPACCLLCVL